MLKRDIAHWTRWLHIYLSMFSFAALLFFAITGITLNHPGWTSGQAQLKKLTGKLNPAWVTSPDTALVAKLEIVEYFRSTYNVRARVTDFRIEETECSLSFKGPGYNADAFIDRSTGEYEVTITTSGSIAVLNDLHKGRDAGATWAAAIDIAAILMVLVSLTGFLMIFFLKKKRFAGLVLSALGALFIIVLYYLFAQ